MGFSLSCQMARICICRNPEEKAMDWKCFTKEEKEKETNRDKGSPNLRDSNLCIYLFLYMQHVHVRERERERERGEEWSSRILIIGVTGSSKVNESWAERERERCHVGHWACSLTLPLKLVGTVFSNYTCGRYQ